MGYRDRNLLDSLFNEIRTIREKQLIKHNEHILATLSGGQDSACLGFMLFLLKKQLDYQIGSLWCHHLWQRSSFFTMLHLARYNLSYSSRIGCHIATKPVLSEQTARDWRHAAIQRAYLFYSYDLCAQGHTKSDRVETVFFNLVRGTGLSGISALQWCCERSVLPNNRLYGILPDFSNSIGSTPSQDRMQALLCITNTQVERAHSGIDCQWYRRDATRDILSYLDAIKPSSKDSVTNLLMRRIVQQLQYGSRKSTHCALNSELGGKESNLSFPKRKDRFINLRSKRGKASTPRSVDRRS